MERPGRWNDEGKRRRQAETQARWRWRSLVHAKQRWRMGIGIVKDREGEREMRRQTRILTRWRRCSTIHARQRRWKRIEIKSEGEGQQQQSKRRRHQRQAWEYYREAVRNIFVRFFHPLGNLHLTLWKIAERRTHELAWSPDDLISRRQSGCFTSLWRWGATSHVDEWKIRSAEWKWWSS